MNECMINITNIWIINQLIKDDKAMEKKVCVIVGVGPGNGTAFAYRFAKAGYHLALLARSIKLTERLAAELDKCFAYECDVTDDSSIQKAVQQIYHDLGGIDVVVYNAGSGQWGNIEEVTLKDFENNWRVNAFGLMAFCQQAIPSMKQKGHGSIIIIGATASNRGAIKTAAFAPAKAAQKSLAESMAKYLWPLGIHVALVIIDGIVDLPKTREHMPNKPDDFFVKPDDVANTVFWLTQQPKSTWAFEVDVRPYQENW